MGYRGRQIRPTGGASKTSRKTIIPSKRINELTAELIKAAGYTYKHRETCFKACLRSIEGEARHDERQKIADQIRSMKLDQITDAGSIADAILKGE